MICGVNVLPAIQFTAKNAYVKNIINSMTTALLEEIFCFSIFLSLPMIFDFIYSSSQIHFGHRVFVHISYHVNFYLKNIHFS